MREPGSQVLPYCYGRNHAAPTELETNMKRADLKVGTEYAQKHFSTYRKVVLVDGNGWRMPTYSFRDTPRTEVALPGGTIATTVAKQEKGGSRCLVAYTDHRGDLQVTVATLASIMGVYEEVDRVAKRTHERMREQVAQRQVAERYHEAEMERLLARTQRTLVAKGVELKYGTVALRGYGLDQHVQLSSKALEALLDD